MPSSMIFVGLVVMWLLILVPAVARRRQEVARPSVTALSGRVLERTPRRDPDADRERRRGRDVEVDVRQELEPARAGATRTEPEAHPPPGAAGGRARAAATSTASTAGPGATSDAEPDRRPRRSADERRSRRPGAPPRYRPGRGGYDPQAAALTARARYAFRQRAVLILLILAVGTAVAAVFTVPAALVGARRASTSLLVGYLAYLRRQVRVEEAIRRRRSARIGAPRRAPDSETDDARSGPRRRTATPDRSPQPTPAADRS